MAKKHLYGNDITASCNICIHGNPAANGDAILCAKRGVMPLHERCRRFVYDPLRRIPKQPPPLRQYEAEEFSI